MFLGAVEDVGSAVRPFAPVVTVARSSLGGVGGGEAGKGILYGTETILAAPQLLEGWQERSNGNEVQSFVRG